jgi:hypothetical protein
MKKKQGEWNGTVACNVVEKNRRRIEVVIEKKQLVAQSYKTIEIAQLFLLFSTT